MALLISRSLASSTYWELFTMSTHLRGKQPAGTDSWGRPEKQQKGLQPNYCGYTCRYNKLIDQTNVQLCPLEKGQTQGATTAKKVYYVLFDVGKYILKYKKNICIFTDYIKQWNSGFLLFLQNYAVVCSSWNFWQKIRNIAPLDYNPNNSSTNRVMSLNYNEARCLLPDCPLVLVTELNYCKRCSTAPSAGDVTHTHQSNPAAKLFSMAGAMSFADVMMYFSASDFL